MEKKREMQRVVKELNDMFPEKELTKHPMMYDKDYYHYEILDSHVKIKEEISIHYPDQFDEEGNSIVSVYKHNQAGFFLISCHEYLNLAPFEQWFCIPDFGLKLLNE